MFTILVDTVLSALNKKRLTKWERVRLPLGRVVMPKRNRCRRHCGADNMTQSTGTHDPGPEEGFRDRLRNRPCKKQTGARHKLQDPWLNTEDVNVAWTDTTGIHRSLHDAERERSAVGTTRYETVYKEHTESSTKFCAVRVFLLNLRMEALAKNGMAKCYVGSTCTAPNNDMA